VQRKNHQSIKGNHKHLFRQKSHPEKKRTDYMSKKHQLQKPFQFEPIALCFDKSWMGVFIFLTLSISLSHSVNAAAPKELIECDEITPYPTNPFSFAKHSESTVSPASSPSHSLNFTSGKSGDYPNFTKDKKFVKDLVNISRSKNSFFRCKFDSLLKENFSIALLSQNELLAIENASELLPNITLPKHTTAAMYYDEITYFLIFLQNCSEIHPPLINIFLKALFHETEHAFLKKESGHEGEGFPFAKGQEEKFKNILHADLAHIEELIIWLNKDSTALSEGQATQIQKLKEATETYEPLLFVHPPVDLDYVKKCQKQGYIDENLNFIRNFKAGEDSLINKKKTPRYVFSFNLQNGQYIPYSRLIPPQGNKAMAALLDLQYRLKANLGNDSYDEQLQLTEMDAAFHEFSVYPDFFKIVGKNLLKYHEEHRSPEYVSCLKSSPR
jgi:hypothetical protein